MRAAVSGAQHFGSECNTCLSASLSNSMMSLIKNEKATCVANGPFGFWTLGGVQILKSLMWDQSV